MALSFVAPSDAFLWNLIAYYMEPHGTLQRFIAVMASHGSPMASHASPMAAPWQSHGSPRGGRLHE